jgi:exosortase family protein XrtF
MNRFPMREFRPTVTFLIKFLVLYIVGNLLYGLYITYYHPKPDPLTNIVTANTAWVLKTCGQPVTTMDHVTKPTTLVLLEQRAILAVYEGCNGLNAIIIFVSFLLAFGPISKPLAWFLPIGVLIIHLTNLGRITLLFFVTEYMPDYLYFAHKFFFTAILYLVIFLLWLVWVNKFSWKKS